MKICARLERADAEHRQLREQVDAVGFATLLLDADARVGVANRAAQALLQAGRGPQLVAGRLGFAEARDQRAFERALAEVLGPGAQRDSASFMVAPNSELSISVLLRRLRREDGARRRTGRGGRFICARGPPARRFCGWTTWRACSG